MAKKIKLHGKDTDNLYALVDDADFEWLNQYRWGILRLGTHNYAQTTVNYQPYLMHRVVMACPKGMVVNHWDNNGLNCQRGNMRVSTYAENNQYRLFTNSRAGFKGLSLQRNGKYAVTISSNKQRYYLGQWDSPELAASIYDTMALHLNGDFAGTNAMIGTLKPTQRPQSLSLLDAYDAALKEMAE